MTHQSDYRHMKAPASDTTSRPSIAPTPRWLVWSQFDVTCAFSATMAAVGCFSTGDSQDESPAVDYAGPESCESCHAENYAAGTSMRTGA